MLLACVGSLPYALSRSDSGHGAVHGPRRFEAARSEHALLPPSWAPHAPDEQVRRHQVALAEGKSPRHLLGTDRLGRSIAVRCLLGGAISLGVGICAAAIAVVIGTLYGTIAAYCGGRVDAGMMRVVDVLYGLPNILLVVLLAVAVDGLAAGADGSSGEGSVTIKSGFGINRDVLNILTLLVAISAVSWLTMARVIRGQVLSLKEQPFMEACRAIGVPWHRQFFRHLLPNLLGPIIVYATLTLPTAILSESFLSFLGIGVQEPLPSWGNLAASGLSELNVVRMRWWLILWPCLFVAVTLLALNFMGEGLRERFDPKRRAIR
ncbi:MAG: ABC transporter permease [Phycisphaerales bacterium]|nr:ABC transporter permease [Phycisphaerales bacterium]MCI0632003.1 ABC transporter permease [Phycisphaerales bacterium]